MAACFFLVVCKTCDDVMKAVDSESRTCECGLVAASMDGDTVVVRDDTGKALVVQVEWDSMDRMIAGSLFLGMALARDSEQVTWKK